MMVSTWILVMVWLLFTAVGLLAAAWDWFKTIRW